MAASRSSRRLHIVRMADVEPREVRWLWRPWIPLGMLTVFDGDPGQGKSTVTLDLAARLSRGDTMPDRSPGPPAATVVILSDEDDPACVIRPRLDAAGADVRRVLTPTIQEGQDDREVTICPENVVLLEGTVVQYGALLVIIDPLMAFLPSQVDSHRDQDVRRTLSMLRRLAERSGAAVVVVRHMNKTHNPNPLYRGGGSIGIIGAARAGIMLAADPDDPTGETRVLAVTKSNLAPRPPSLRLRIVAASGSEPPSVHWEGESAHTPATLLAIPADPEERERERGREQRARAQVALLDRAKVTLRERIAQWAANGGPMRKNADAIPFLGSLGVSRDVGRELIQEGIGRDWVVEGGGRRSDPEVLLPLCSTGKPQESETPAPTRLPEASTPAQRTNGGPQETHALEAAPAEVQMLTGVACGETASEPACPACGGQLLHGPGAMICRSCHLRFPVDQEAPSTGHSLAARPRNPGLEARQSGQSGSPSADGLACLDGHRS